MLGEKAWLAVNIVLNPKVGQKPWFVHEGIGVHTWNAKQERAFPKLLATHLEAHYSLTKGTKRPIPKWQVYPMTYHLFYSINKKQNSDTKSGYENNCFKAKTDANKSPLPSCNKSQHLTHSVGYHHWVMRLMILCFVKSDLLSEHGLICQYCAVH